MPRTKRARPSESSTSTKRPVKTDAEIESALDEEEEGNRKKKVRWDGATPELEEETDTRETEESSEEDDKADKVRIYPSCLEMIQVY